MCLIGKGRDCNSSYISNHSSSIQQFVISIHDQVKYKDNKLVFSAKHAILRRKGKDWLTQHQHNVSKYDLQLIETTV